MTEDELTPVIIKDPNGNGFTAFFAYLPNIVAEGDTEEEAKTNLIHTIQAVREHTKTNQTSK